MKLKKLSDQVIVITGATSGIGLTTARQAAQKGARLVLVARNEGALKPLVEELTNEGHEAIYVVADVGKAEDVKKVAKAATDKFGHVDTWINNAGVTIFGRLEEVSEEDSRRLFDTNFWGVVHGSLQAAKLMKGRGGAIINLGSEVSDTAIPLQGMYSASKHAIKGFTDALRMELDQDNSGISVTLVKPGSIDTMYVDHAKNYLEVEPSLPPPIYSPDLVADAILFAAENPRRDIYVGAAARLMSTSAYYMPRVVDKVMERLMFNLQMTDQPKAEHRKDALHTPMEDLKESHGNGQSRNSGLYSLASSTLSTAGHLINNIWERRPHMRK